MSSRQILAMYIVVLTSRISVVMLSSVSTASCCCLLSVECVSLLLFIVAIVSTFCGNSHQLWTPCPSAAERAARLCVGRLGQQLGGLSAGRVNIQDQYLGLVLATRDNIQTCHMTDITCHMKLDDMTINVMSRTCHKSSHVKYLAMHASYCPNNLTN